MEKTKKKWLICWAAPLGVLALLAAVYALWGLFPFGEKTLSWCDMSQQVVPLLAELQDVLRGRADLFYSLQNAGGMNFWGVFLFFLSSPFSLSAAFVDKADLMLLMNVLVALKLALAAFTSALLFRSWLPRLGRAAVWTLSVLYALGGFGLLFYQNLMWLDVMALFPLLLLAFGRLCRGKPLAFILALSALLALNFYLSYMAVAFLLLGFAAYLLLAAPKARRGRQALLLGYSCLVSACLTGPVWLPALLQYAGSARGVELLSSVSSRLFPRLYTTLPLLLSTPLLAAVLPFFRGGRSWNARRERCFLVLFLLMTVPLLLDPVNKLWHGGSYQAFPARYGYITTLMGLLLAGCVLQRWEVPAPGKPRPAAAAAEWGALALVTAGGVLLLACRMEELDAYVTSLWGDAKSFSWLLVFFAGAALAYGLLLWLRRYAGLGKRTFSLLLCLLTVVSCLFHGGVYVGAAAREDRSWRETVSLGGQLQDSGFYRVKAGAWDLDSNAIGAMGYNTWGHYTSLTSKTTLFTMKKLGYSSNWMEISPAGGSLLTDALLSNKYVIAQEKAQVPLGELAVSGEKRQIYRNPLCLPLGLRVKGEISQWEALPEGSRFDVQQALYRMLGGEGELFTLYQPTRQENASVVGTGEGLTWVSRAEGGDGPSRLIYQVEVQGRQALYFDAFRDLSTRLTEPINDSFAIKVNGRSAAESYPAKRNNGLLYLGLFENEPVTVEVEVLKDVSLASFGLAGLNTALLEQAVARAPGVEFQVSGRSFTAQVQAGEGEFLHVALPYDQGFSARVNGRPVTVSRVNGGFLAVPLEPGKNQVELSFLPKGMGLGAGLLALGGVLLVLFALALRRGWLARPGLERAALAGFLGAGAAVLLVFYLLPLGLYLGRRVF